MLPDIDEAELIVGDVVVGTFEQGAGYVEISLGKLDRMPKVQPLHA